MEFTHEILVKKLLKRGGDCIFGIERLLSYCGVSLHCIAFFFIALDSTFAEPFKEVYEIENYSDFDSDQRFTIQFENKSSIFSRNIQLRKEPNISSETEDSTESEKITGS